jgi:hypothetical protein
MSRRIWNLDIEGNHHVVNLDFNGFTLSGKVIVDGKFIEGWSAALKSKDIKFNVGSKPAILRYIINPLSPNKQELYVDGVLMNQSK